VYSAFTAVKDGNYTFSVDLEEPELEGALGLGTYAIRRVWDLAAHVIVRYLTLQEPQGLQQLGPQNPNTSTSIPLLNDTPMIDPMFQPN
jgi:hypothetical protein